MQKYGGFFIFCLIALGACNNATNSNMVQKKDSLVSLPFFNQPDWTPEWIGETDSAYKNIHAIPSFSFLDQNGIVVDENLIHLLQESFKDDTSILLLSHSVTPETDDVMVLNKYALDNKVDAAKWHLLTGDKKAIYGLAKQQYFAGDTVGYYQSGNEFLHTENFILVDQHRRIRGVYNGTLPVEINRIIEDIAILKSEITSF